MKAYTDEERRFIKKNYKKMSYREISNKIGRKEKSVKAIIGRMISGNEIFRKKEKINLIDFTLLNIRASKIIEPEFNIIQPGTTIEYNGKKHDVIFDFGMCISAYALASGKKTIIEKINICQA